MCPNEKLVVSKIACVCVYFHIFVLNYVEDEKLMPEKLLADEELSMVSSIRDTFLPRLGERDRGLFSSIILDLWPNVEVPLDFAGNQKDAAKEEPPTTAVSKTTSRPFSQTTFNTTTKSLKNKRPVVPGIKGRGSVYTFHH